MGQFHRDTSDFGVERHPAPTDMPGVSEPSFVQALLTPGRVFDDPREVVQHPWFTHEEKRAVLTSKARDELAVEHGAKHIRPESRPEPRAVAVIDALARFDAAAASEVSFSREKPSRASGALRCA